MKNVTVSVPDDVYRAARVRAAEKGTSLSALVAGYLGSLGDREAEFSRLVAQQSEVLGKIDRFSARDRLDRDEVHRACGSLTPTFSLYAVSRRPAQSAQGRAALEVARSSPIALWQLFDSRVLQDVLRPGDPSLLELAAPVAGGRPRPGVAPPAARARARVRRARAHRRRVRPRAVRSPRLCRARRPPPSVRPYVRAPPAACARVVPALRFTPSRPRAATLACAAGRLPPAAARRAARRAPALVRTPSLLTRALPAPARRACLAPAAPPRSAPCCLLTVAAPARPRGVHPAPVAAVACAALRCLAPALAFLRPSPPRAVRAPRPRPPSACLLSGGVGTIPSPTSRRRSWSSRSFAFHWPT